MESIKSKANTARTWRVKVVQLEQSGQIDENTESIYQEALHDAAQESGHDHADVAEAATYLADFYMFLGRYMEAEALYKRSVKIYGNSHGEDSMIYSMALRNLAEAYYARGRGPEAEKLRFTARGIFG